MNISDEQLSAFLDSELSETEMELVRQQLAIDESLSDRLAELAMADQQVREFAQQIDQTPLPDSITTLMAAPRHADNVIAFPFWRRLPPRWSHSPALAASVAIAIGIGWFGWWQMDTRGDTAWLAVAAALDQTPSHATSVIDAQTRVTPLLSFAAQETQFCRQYRQQIASQTQINVACRYAGQSWRLVSSVAAENDDESLFEPASQNDASAAQIDQLIVGEIFDVAQERAAIANSWQTPTP